MRKSLVIITTALMLLLSAASHMPRVPSLVVGLSGVTLYADFLDGLQSGEVTRSDISFDSWYSFVSFTSEQINFAPTDDGKQALTYRVRQPFVFWHNPAPNYFDGETYFYKHNGAWFRDRNNRFTAYLRQDFMGIPTHILDTYPASRDEVYYLDNQYFAHIDLQPPDASEIYRITATLDADKQFEKIDIAVLEQGENGIPDYQQYYKIRYRHVNGKTAISPPDDLDPSSIR